MVKRRVRFAIWWRRAGMGLRSLVVLLGIAAFALLIYWQQPQEESARTSSRLAVLVLANLNIVILCLLAFLIGRNIVKLVFDRRRKILGSKLRLRLVVAFVGLTLIPIIILFTLASGLLTRAMEGWFSPNVEDSVNGALEVARQHYNWMQEYVRRVSENLAVELRKSGWSEQAPALQDYLEARRKEWGLFSISLLDARGKLIAEASNAIAVIDNFKEPPIETAALERALKHESDVTFEESESSQFVRSYVPLSRGDKARVLVTTLRISPELSQALATVNASYREYGQLKFFKRPLKTNYILTLAMITGLLLFSAVWFAFYIARELAVPIQRLAEATRSVAKGRYDVQIRERGDDEMAFLVRSFNQMTAEIRQSRRESERRRVYIETILANLAVGVIGIDRQQQVNSINAAAARSFSIDNINAAIGRPLMAVLRNDDYQQIQPLLEILEESSEEGRPAPTIKERQIEVINQGRQLKILCTAGRIKDDVGQLIGYVLLFDDITELSRAQHMSAWREVAQRIAHEIKNPLTPIRLSAQRLSKLVSQEPTDAGPKIVDCAQTIVEHVDSIKRLADEFSHFARMPRAEFKQGNLNSLISDAIAPFAQSHSEIIFQFIADNEMPEILMDAEQIRRILINLIDNAITALNSIPPDTYAPQAGPRIMIRSRYDRRRRIASFEISDNGPGIKNADKARIFEPYFSTKQGGTGLGLAIVTSIVSDHQGEIRVYDNQPCGAKFIVELPARPLQLTQRRFAAS